MYNNSPKCFYLNLLSKHIFTLVILYDSDNFHVSQKSSIVLFFSFLPAVNDDWAGATSVAFIHLPEKQGSRDSRERKENKEQKKKGLIINYFL